MEDQIGTSPSHKPIFDRDAVESAVASSAKMETITMERQEVTTRDQTLEFLKYESEHSSIAHAPSSLATTDADKVCTEYLCFI